MGKDFVIESSRRGTPHNKIRTKELLSFPTSQQGLQREVQTIRAGQVTDGDRGREGGAGSEGECHSEYKNTEGKLESMDNEMTAIWPFTSIPDSHLVEPTLHFCMFQRCHAITEDGLRNKRKQHE